MIDALVFSKDRAMQLDATLHSLRLHCRDSDILAITVLYVVSNETHARHYARLVQEHPYVRFVEEKDFKSDLLSLIGVRNFLLFLVDDNIFVKDFSVEDAVGGLQAIPQAIVFSLRLGRNTIYCYPVSRYQRLPEFGEAGKGMLKFDWTKSERDFGYPFDISSSIYRTSDIVPLLEKLDFCNPNTLEGHLDGRKHLLQDRNLMLCFENSVSFCNPINKVQSVLMDNRSGRRKAYTPSSLAQKFDEGYRIDVNKYIGLILKACHQEVRLRFSKIGRRPFNQKNALRRFFARLAFWKSYRD